MSGKHRSTIWLYDDDPTERELAEHLSSLDRYRRAEFIRFIAKSGWMAFKKSNSRSLTPRAKATPKAASSKTPKNNKINEIKKPRINEVLVDDDMPVFSGIESDIDHDTQITAVPVVQKKAVNNPFANNENGDATVDPLSALMSI